MTKQTVIIDYDFVPRHKPIGTYLIVRLDKPEEVSIGDMKINVDTGLSASGLIAIPQESIDMEARAVQLGQVEVTVHAIGGCAFQRQDLKDAIGVIKEGSRVVIKQFQGRSIPNALGHKTLFYHITENDVLGVVE